MAGAVRRYRLYYVDGREDCKNGEQVLAWSSLDSRQRPVTLLASGQARQDERGIDDAN
jgi:hypothetical protein